MVASLLLAQLFLCLAILHREVVLGQCRNFASSLFFVAYTIVCVVEPLVLHVIYGGATSIVRDSTSQFADPFVYYLYSCYSIGLLSVFLLLGRGLTLGDSEGSVGPGLGPGRDRQTLNWMSVGLVAGCVLFIYSTGMSVVDLIYSSRFAWFGEDSLSLFWLTVSSYFLPLAAVVAYQLRVGVRGNRFLVLAGLAAVVAQGVMTKDRKWLIFLVSGWLAGQYEASGRRLLITKKGALVLAGLFVILVMSQFLRDVLVRYAVGQPIVIADELARWGSRSIELGDISYFYRASLEALHQNIHNDFVVPLALPRRLFFFFLPVGYSGGLKVEDISATFSDVVDGGDSLRRGNMPPGLFGLFVVSFGWFVSLLLIPLVAVLLRKLDSICRAGRGAFREVLLSLYLFSVVLALRGDDSSAVYFVVSTTVVVVAIRTVTGRGWVGAGPPPGR